MTSRGTAMIYKIIWAQVYLPKFHIWSAPSRQLWMDQVLVGLLVLSHQIFSVSPEELKCVKILERDESRPQDWLLKTLANIYLLYFKTLTPQPHELKTHHTSIYVERRQSTFIYKNVEGGGGRGGCN